MPMMWLQLHGLQCLVTVTAAVIAVVGGCAAAVAAVAHAFCSHKHEMFMMLLGHVWWCW